MTQKIMAFLNLVVKMISLTALGIHLVNATESRDIFSQSQAMLIKALKKHGVLNSDRILVHASYVCTLAVAKKGRDNNIEHTHYLVVDVQERIPGAMQARGFNRWVILDNNLTFINSLEYYDERVLFCDQHYLYLDTVITDERIGFKDLEALYNYQLNQGDSAKKGNRIAFDGSGQVIGIDNTDDNQWLGIQQKKRPHGARYRQWNTERYPKH